MDSKQYTKKLSSKWTVNTIRAADDVVLRYALYRNSDAPLRRCIIYINGRTEWIEKNMEIPDWLDLPADCGYLTWDLRGQGASGGERSWIDSYDTYLSDAKLIMNQAFAGTNPTTAIIAHSTGGLIAVYGTLKGAFSPFAIIASSPLFALRNEPVPRLVARPVAKLLSCLAWSKASTGVGTYDKPMFETNRLTHDYDMYMLARNSPYRVPSARFGWVNATFDATKYIQTSANISRLSAPTLLLLASEETIVDPEGITGWCALAKKHAKVEVRLDIIHGARHEIFSEIPRYRDQAMSKARAWLQTFLK